MISQDGRDGLRVAKLFRQHRVGVDVRKCDLESICADDDIEIVPSRVSNPGYTACLRRCPDGAGGLIALAPGNEGGRRRFSIAHELGHYHIPRHKNHYGDCGDREMRMRQRDAAAGETQRREWESNDFATELLMPRRLFGEDARGMDISIESSVKLASPDFYEVSVMAAAWRVIQTTRESAAIIVSTDGRVEWMYPSDAFRLRLTERGQTLNGDTAASAVFRDKTGTPRPHEVASAAWLDYPEEVRGTLLESTHFIPSLNQAISLLWLVDGDGELGDGRD